MVLIGINSVTLFFRAIWNRWVQIAQACSYVVFENFIHAHLFQLSLEIMWLMQIQTFMNLNIFSKVSVVIGNQTEIYVDWRMSQPVYRPTLKRYINWNIKW